MSKSVKNKILKINKMIQNDAPLWDLIDACAWIDISSCFDPVFEMPAEQAEELQTQWKNKMNPFTGRIERKIGNTWYVIETECAGTELLANKVKRLIFSDKGVIC